MRHKIFLKRRRRVQAGIEFVGEHEGEPVTVIVAAEDWRRLGTPPEVILRIQVEDPPTSGE